MSLELCCIPTKQLFYDSVSGYKVLSCKPKGYYKDLQLNKYNNFTLSGNNLENLEIGEDTNLSIELDTKSKYPCSYVLIGYVGMEVKADKIVVNPQYELEILSRYMEKRQAVNVNKAYPNFVELVLNNQEDEIDYHKIKNVANKRLTSYVEKLKKDCKNILFFPSAIELGISDNDMIFRLSANFGSPQVMLETYKTNPYYIYIDLLGMSFTKADELVLSKLPEFIDSKTRCEYACLEILGVNESSGDTRLNANVLASQLKVLAPETRQHIIETVTNNSKIHYDNTTKNVSLERTYKAEENIANHILERLSNDSGYRMDWQKYQNIDNTNYTDEQMEILKIVGSGSKIGILTGSAGCVDCDTEFFTGYGWKRIADYQEGDMVLQYNQDGTAELVNPERYIKVPCDTMWHFENGNDLDQVVCDEHRIVYWQNKKQKECKIVDIYNDNNWKGDFKTTFNYEGRGVDVGDDDLKMFKNFSSEWYNCNKRQLRLISTMILYASKENKMACTAYKEIADFIQFALASCGYRATIDNGTIQSINLYDNDYVEYDHSERLIRKFNTKDGYKYCFTVPSGMLVLRRKNCIFITGNCGKTTSVKALLKMLEDNGKGYTLLAPTGIAAKRLRESTGKHTSTIHMFLACGGKAEEYIIIDEFSIVGVHLLSQLLEYIGTMPNLIFVCDNAQLASISCGNIIQDLLDANIIPRANLTKVFRYGSSGLSTMATDARAGEMKHLHDKYDDFNFLPIDNALEQVIDVYSEMLSKGYKKDEILILSPYNTGNKGTYIINNAIQEKFNPNVFTPISYKRQKMGEIRFKVGDRVLNTVNNYNMTCLDYNENGEEIFSSFSCMNGDCGTIREYRVIDNKPSLIIEFDNGLGVVQGKDIGNLLLGYSISCHKCITEDCLILTNYGVKTIKDIYENFQSDSDFLVYNGKNFEKPSNFFKNEVSDCKRITLKNGSSITVTYDHGLTTINKNGELVRINSDELKIGDCVALRFNSEVFGNNIDLENYLIEKNSKMNKDIKLPAKLTPELATLLGLICADGTVFRSGFRIAKRYEEVIDFAAKAIKNAFGRDGRKYFKIEKSRGKNGAWYIELSSTLVSKWLLSLGGLSPNNKYVPQCILDAPREIQCCFMKGLFEDGAVNVKKGIFDHVEFTTTHKKCANQIQVMLLNMGILSYLKFYGKAYTLYIYRGDAIAFKNEIGFICNRKNSLLDVYVKTDEQTRICSKNFIPNIKNICKNIVEKYPEIELSRSLKSLLFYFEKREMTKIMVKRFIKEYESTNDEKVMYLKELLDNYVFYPVTNIEDVSSDTYCLEMPETHHFIQNGFYGWNCQGSESKAVIILIDKEHKRLLSNNLLYVALSRARETMTLIGDENVINEALKVRENMERDTNLGDMLIKGEQYER